MMPKKRVSRRYPIFFPFLFATLILSFVIVGLLVGLQMMGTVQNYQNQAAAVPTIQLRMHGQTVAPGELRVDFLLNTGVYKISSTQVSAKLQNIAASDVRLDLTNALNLQNVTQSVTAQPDGAVVTFTQKASTDATKPAMTRGQELTLASVYIKKPQGTAFTMTINKSLVKIPVIGQPTAVVDATTSQQFTVLTYVPGKASPTATPFVPVVYLPVTPTPPPNRSCNEPCSNKNDCVVGFTCYSNRCRNPNNLGNEQCAAPAPTAAPTARPTVRPTVRPTPTPAATLAPSKGEDVDPIVTPLITPTPSPSTSPSPTPSPSPTATPTATPVVYDEGSLRVTPSPTAKPRVSPSPSPKAVTQAVSGLSRRTMLAILLAFIGIGVVIPAGIYFYRRV